MPRQGGSFLGDREVAVFRLLRFRSMLAYVVDPVDLVHRAVFDRFPRCLPAGLIRCNGSESTPLPIRLGLGLSSSPRASAGEPQVLASSSPVCAGRDLAWFVMNSNGVDADAVSCRPLLVDSTSFFRGLILLRLGLGVPPLGLRFLGLGLFASVVMLMMPMFGAGSFNDKLLCVALHRASFLSACVKDALLLPLLPTVWSTEPAWKQWDTEPDLPLLLLFLLAAPRGEVELRGELLELQPLFELRLRVSFMRGAPLALTCATISDALSRFNRFCPATAAALVAFIW